MTTGEKIKQLRKKNGLTQEQLAELVDVAVTSVRRWEWGENTPTVKFIQKLAGVLNTTPEYLLEDEDKNPVIITATSEQHTTRDEGMAEITLGNGQNFKVPATPEGFAFLKEIYLASLKNTAV